MGERRPLAQIAIRVDPALRTRIVPIVERHHGGNESEFFREAARVYVALRDRLGVQYDPTLGLWLGAPFVLDGLGAAPEPERGAVAP